MVPAHRLRRLLQSQRSTHLHHQYRAKRSLQWAVLYETSRCWPDIRIFGPRNDISGLTRKRRFESLISSRRSDSGLDQLRQAGRGGAALKRQQIKGRGLATSQNRQASMGLPAMMGLMIEHMQEYVRNGF